MKQFIGIRFSRYGQVRIGTYESQNEEPFVFGQVVVVQAESALSAGHVVWQGGELNSLFSSHKNEDPDLDGENTHAKTLGKAKGEFAENFEITQIQSYLSVRPANSEELISNNNNDILGKAAHIHCKKCVRERDLDMKLVDVEVLLDKSKIIFYFTAPTRIDFRELVKDLVREYRTRIELRQIGVRHETQMLGTLGNCGMVVCCRRYLKEFAPVTIKMAKEQNLFLNPAKISGMCGRLLCCLSYEQESYDLFHRSAPKIGKRYQTDRGFLRVIRSNMFRNSIFALNDEGQEEEIDIDVWNSLNANRLESVGGSSTVSCNDSNSSYEYTEIGSDGFESADPELVGLLDETSEDKAGRAGNRDNTKRKPPQHAPHAHRPREKVQKRNSFDVGDSVQQQNTHHQNSRNDELNDDSRNLSQKTDDVK